MPKQPQYIDYSDKTVDAILNDERLSEEDKVSQIAEYYRQYLLRGGIASQSVSSYEKEVREGIEYRKNQIEVSYQQYNFHGNDVVLGKILAPVRIMEEALSEALVSIIRHTKADVSPQDQHVFNEAKRLGWSVAHTKQYHDNLISNARRYYNDARSEFGFKLLVNFILIGLIFYVPGLLVKMFRRLSASKGLRVTQDVDETAESLYNKGVGWAVAQVLIPIVVWGGVFFVYLGMSAPADLVSVQSNTNSIALTNANYGGNMNGNMNSNMNMNGNMNSNMNNTNSDYANSNDGGNINSNANVEYPNYSSSPQLTSQLEAEQPPAPLEAWQKITGKWVFSWGHEGQRRATLNVTDGKAELSLESEGVIAQKVSVRIEEDGVAVYGQHPIVFDETSVEVPRYSSDVLFFGRQSDGSYKVWGGDRKTIWEPVKILKPSIDVGKVETLSEIDGEWNLSYLNENALLKVQNGVGQLFIGHKFRLSQKMNIQDTSQGIHLIGYDLLISNSSTRPPFYTPDQLLFRPQGSGSYLVQTRDEVNGQFKDWTNVVVLNRP